MPNICPICNHEVKATDQWCDTCGVLLSEAYRCEELYNAAMERGESAADNDAARAAKSAADSAECNARDPLFNESIGINAKLQGE